MSLTDNDRGKYDKRAMVKLIVTLNKYLPPYSGHFYVSLVSVRYDYSQMNPESTIWHKYNQLYHNIIQALKISIKSQALAYLHCVFMCVLQKL